MTPVAFTRRLLLNPDTGMHHAHRRCKALQGPVQGRLVEVERRWTDMPYIRLCGYCCARPW